MRTDKQKVINPVYSELPENFNEPAIPAKKNKMFIKLSDIVFKNLLKNYFYSVRVKNKDNFSKRNPNYANIFYGFHSCWWDGLFAAFFCRNLYKSNFYMMIKDMYRLPALSYLGGFSVERKPFSAALKSINYSINLLKNPENTLWLFPQGKVVSPDRRPIKFEGGIAHICKKLEGVNLIPVAHRYTFLRNEKPEILAEVGEPIIIEKNITDKNLFLEQIQNDFEKLLDKQKIEISHGKLEDYEFIIHNDLHWPKVIENRLKTLLRKKF